MMSFERRRDFKNVKHVNNIWYQNVKHVNNIWFQNDIRLSNSTDSRPLLDGRVLAGTTSVSPRASVRLKPCSYEQPRRANEWTNEWTNGSMSGLQ